MPHHIANHLLENSSLSRNTCRLKNHGGPANNLIPSFHDANDTPSTPTCMIRKGGIRREHMRSVIQGGEHTCTHVTEGYEDEPEQAPSFLGMEEHRKDKKNISYVTIIKKRKEKGYPQAPSPNPHQPSSTPTAMCRTAGRLVRNSRRTEKE